MRTATWLLVPALAGCAVYAPPGPDVPQAELMITSNLEEAADTADASRIENIFYGFGDAGCTEALGGLAHFVKLFGQAPEVVRVAAGKRIYIRASTKTAKSSGQQEITTFCYNLVSFVPEPGKDYLMHQDAANEGTALGPRLVCRTTLSTIGEPPVKSFMEHEFRGECARQIGR